MVCRTSPAAIQVVLKGLPSNRPHTRHALRSLHGVTSKLHRNIHVTSRCASGIHWVRQKNFTPVPDTVYALSTAPGRAAIAVIRVSGPACLDIYGGLCPDRPFPHPRTATLRKLYDPRSSSADRQRVLDAGALVLYFPAPKTVTGEDILELHVHGGPAIVRSVLEAIPACTNSRDRCRPADYNKIRPAEAGEFTKRAFYNGRLDLTQAEALGDTLAAETEQQRRLAIGGSGISLATRYEEWRTMLLSARGELEALIDFSEDQHFDESPRQFVSSITTQAVALKRQIELHIQNASKGELLRGGISIALLGAPNAGKSSLLNRIVGREAAIVGAEAGTTRDIIDVSVDIRGWLCRLGDMAGLRVKVKQSVLGIGDGPIEAVEEEGIRRARARALESDLVIVLLPVEPSRDTSIFGHLSINEEVTEVVVECQAAGKEIVYVMNKIDLLGDGDNPPSEHEAKSCLHRAFPKIPPNRIFAISCADADTDSSSAAVQDPGNIQRFLKGLASIFSEMTTALTDAATSSTNPISAAEAQSYWSVSLSISHRQSTYLKQCLTHLNDFLQQTGLQPSPQRGRPPPLSLSTHHIGNHDDLIRELHPGSEGEIDIVALAEHLRFAADCLAKITGRGEGGDVEDVLGVVFEK